MKDLLVGTYATGTVLDGSAADELKGVLRRNQLVYSVQNGVLQFQRTGKGVGLKVRAAEIGPDTGLVGTPMKDATGELIITSLLIPNVSVGGYIVLQSKAYKGLYRIVGVQHKLSTQGDEWYHVMNCLPA